MSEKSISAVVLAGQRSKKSALLRRANVSLEIMVPVAGKASLVRVLDALRDSSLVCDISAPNGRLDIAPIILPGPVSEVGGINNAFDVYVFGRLKTKIIVMIPTIIEFLIMENFLPHRKGMILIRSVCFE